MSTQKHSSTTADLDSDYLSLLDKPTCSLSINDKFTLTQYGVSILNIMAQASKKNRDQIASDYRLLDIAFKTPRVFEIWAKGPVALSLAKIINTDIARAAPAAITLLAQHNSSGVHDMTVSNITPAIVKICPDAVKAFATHPDTLRRHLFVLYAEDGVISAMPAIFNILSQDEDPHIREDLVTHIHDDNAYILRREIETLSQDKTVGVRLALARHMSYQQALICPDAAKALFDDASTRYALVINPKMAPPLHYKPQTTIAGLLCRLPGIGPQLGKMLYGRAPVPEGLKPIITAQQSHSP